MLRRQGGLGVASVIRLYVIIAQPETHMPYTAVATARTPATIIFVLDLSPDACVPRQTVPAIGRMNDLLLGVLQSIFCRSVRGEDVAPRYRLGFFAYGQPFLMNTLNEIESISSIIQRSSPPMVAIGSASEAFQAVRRVVEASIAVPVSPAPLVCHFTASSMWATDLESLVTSITMMPHGDGNVLVETVYLGSDLSGNFSEDASSWQGIADPNDLSGDSLRGLARMSSALPKSYADLLADNGFSLREGSRLLFPWIYRDLITTLLPPSGGTMART
jgi:hypothetical protein